MAKIKFSQIQLKRAMKLLTLILRRSIKNYLVYLKLMADRSNKKYGFLQPVARLAAGNIAYVMNIYRLQSYEEAIVLLQIMSACENDNGISERQIAERTSISRATVNRIAKTLLGKGCVVIATDFRPRRLAYNFDYMVKDFARKNCLAHEMFALSVMRQSSQLIMEIMEGSVKSQIETQPQG
jgi:predicted transcriptional regulator